MYDEGMRQPRSTHTHSTLLPSLGRHGHCFLINLSLSLSLGLQGRTRKAHWLGAFTAQRNYSNRTQSKAAWRAGGTHKNHQPQTAQTPKRNKIYPDNFPSSALDRRRYPMGQAYRRHTLAEPRSASGWRCAHAEQTPRGRQSFWPRAGPAPRAIGWACPMLSRYSWRTSRARRRCDSCRSQPR